MTGSSLHLQTTTVHTDSNLSGSDLAETMCDEEVEKDLAETARCAGWELIHCVHFQIDPSPCLA